MAAESEADLRHSGRRSAHLGLTPDLRILCPQPRLMPLTEPCRRETSNGETR